MSNIAWAYQGRRYTIYRFPPEIERDIKKLDKSDNYHCLLAWSTDMLWIAGLISVSR